jgi:Ca-activated chloride channel family protein
MNAVAQAVLTSTAGEQVPLKAVSARGRLDGLLFELGIEQQYRNDSQVPIEAVFTFPLPLRAQLLGFELVLGERHLKAVAAPRAQASRDYERAIDKGDAAVLLEHDGNGLYTVSLGNLLPGESATIRYRYAELLDSHQGYVRIQVPTVIAPRYGNPADGGLSGPAVPRENALSSYPFTITLELPGVRESGTVASPTHPIQIASGDTGLSVTLLRQGFLDKDFVLEVAAAALPQGCLLSADGAEWVLLASTALALDKQESRPLALKVLLDCSGSMQGTSIVAAKKALLAILEKLHGDDHIALTRFGSSVEQVTQGLEPADRATIIPLKTLVGRIEADLGGTEMAQALSATVAIPAPRGTQVDILLITDGEIHAISQVVDLAARAGQRLFTIAIGAAPVEALARELAEKTGGGCEFVGPGEDAEGAILRTFKRLRASPRQLAAVSWPGTPAWVAPLPTAVFPGDTVHLMAGFKDKPRAGVSVTVRDAAGSTQVMTQELATEVDGDRIPRLAAARRLTQLQEADASQLAVKYQLVSPYTSLVVVAEREAHEKAQQLPAVVPVPQMLVEQVACACPAPAPYMDRLEAQTDLRLFDRTAGRAAEEAPAPRASRSAAPGRARRRVSGPFGKQRPPDAVFVPNPPPDAAGLTASDESGVSAATLLQLLTDRHGAGEELPCSLDELAACGVSSALIAELALLCHSAGESEETVVRAFLAMLADVLGAAPALVAALSSDVLQERGHRALRQRLLELMKSMGG